MPEQVVIERGAHPDEPLAVIDQQPDVELDAGQLRDRQRAPRPRAARRGRRRARRCGRTCRAHGRRGARRPSTWWRPGPHARRGTSRNRSKAARDMPAVLQRPHPLGAQAASPRQRRGQTRARRPRSSCRPAARRCSRRRRRWCASSCACPHRARSSPASPFTSTESGRPADNACLGAVPRSYQVTPGHPDRRRATQRKPVRPTRPTA